jgi:hypothetical protein
VISAVVDVVSPIDAADCTLDSLLPVVHAVSAIDDTTSANVRPYLFPMSALPVALLFVWRAGDLRRWASTFGGDGDIGRGGAADGRVRPGARAGAAGEG